MEKRDDCLAYVIHLRDEHRKLHGVLKRIEAEWATVADIAVPKTPAKMAAALGQLRDELAAHFSQEDEGGCLEEAVCRLPDLGLAADRIGREHESLLAELDEIIDQVERPQYAATMPKGLRRRFDGFAARLQSHETAECQLLEKAFGAPVEY